METISAALVDDSDDDLKIAHRLRPTGIQCAAIRPPNQESSFERLMELLRARTYDVILLDYRLDDEVPRGYRGGTVAARLKEIHPDMPVVLLTTEEKHEQWVRHNPRVAALFDLLVLKEDLAHKSTRVQRAEEIHDLVASYRALKQATTTTDDTHTIINRLAGATKDDRFVASIRSSVARTPELANWFLRELLAYPGSLLALPDVVARLGIRRDDVKGNALQQWLKSASYEGVFGRIHQRWWRGRLDHMLVHKKRDLREGTATTRAAFISEQIEQEVRPAFCVWCNGEYPERACTICDEPVDASHYLVGTIDDRPAWAEPARVCFRCIAQGAAEHVRLVAGAESIAHRLRTGELKRSA